MVARQTDVQHADLVPKSVAVDAERRRGTPEVPRRSLHRSDDVFLLELLLCEIERDAVREQLVDHLLELRIQVHVGLRELGSLREARILANGIDDEKRGEFFPEAQNLARRKNFPCQRESLARVRVASKKRRGAERLS